MTPPVESLSSGHLGVLGIQTRRAEMLPGMETAARITKQLRMMRPPFTRRVDRLCDDAF